MAGNFITRFGRILLDNDQMAIAHLLQANGLLHVQRVCARCRNPMTLVPDDSYFDKISWRCDNRRCRKRLSVRADTFFQPWSSVNLGLLMMAIHKWTLGTTATVISGDTAIPYRHVLRLCQKLRECCTNKLRRNPITVGGNNQVAVQVDESMFHHKQRQHVGRVARNPVWVFGAVDTSFTPAKGYVEIVQRRNRATLAGVLDQVLNANSTVHSDQWRG